MIIEKIKLFIFKRRWRKMNAHNTTGACNLFNPNLVSVGRYSYGGLNIVMHNDINRVIIGDFCSIAGEVVFIPSADHYVDRVMTFPIKVKCLNEKYEGISKGDIIIDDDVWIGYRATILSGTHIGQGAVIAAGAVVTKDVPPYAIVGGVPASIISYRFSPKNIEEMMKVDYSKLTLIDIKLNEKALYSIVDDTFDLSCIKNVHLKEQNNSSISNVNRNDS